MIELLKGARLQGLPEELGYEVVDLVSGIQGIAYTIYQRFTGTVQISIHTKAKEGKKEDVWCFDARQLEVVSSGLRALRQNAPKVDLPLGILVRDTFSGLKGVTIEKSTHLNGCVEYILIPELNKDTTSTDKMPSCVAIEHQRLEVVKSKEADKIAAIPKKKYNTGCAPRKAI